MQSVSSRIWTRIAVFISYGDNDYTTGTSMWKVISMVSWLTCWTATSSCVRISVVLCPRLFSWAVWHSCRMGARNQEQTRGRIGPQLRLGNLRVGELHFCPLCTALDQASSLSRKLAYVPGPTFGFVKLLASSGSHCTKWAGEQHRQAGFESRLLPDLPLPFIPTLIGLRAFDLVSSRVWWEAATNIRHPGYVSLSVTVLHAWLSYWITLKRWYAIKQRNYTFLLKKTSSFLMIPF